MQPFTLEKSRFFPYFAWGTIIVFSLFVYGVTKNVSAQIQNIKEASEVAQANPLQL